MQTRLSRIENCWLEIQWCMARDRFITGAIGKNFIEPAFLDLCADIQNTIVVVNAVLVEGVAR
jgi:hypothetical protein